MSGSLIGALRVTLGIDTAAFEQGLGIAQKRLNAVGKNMQAFGDRMTDIGSKMTLGVTAPLVAMGAASTKAFSDFEASMSNVATLVDTTTESMEDMGKAVLDISKRVPVAVSDLTSALYDVRSAGIGAGEALGVLENSAKLGVAGLGTTAEAVDLVTSSINAFKLEGDDANKVYDLIFRTVKSGKTTISQLSQGFGAVAGTVAQAGIKIDDYLASVAALTTTGLPAAQAHTQLRAAISGLTRETKLSQEIFSKLGVKTFPELIKKSGGLGGAFAKLREATGGSDAKLLQLLGSTEAYNAVLSISGAQNKAYTDTLNGMRDGTEALGEAFDKQAAATAKKMQLMRNKLNAAAVQIGQVVVPVLVKIGEFVGKVAEAFSKLSPGIQSAVVAFGAIAAAVGPVLMVIGGIASGIGALVPMFAGLATVMGTAGFAATLGAIAAAAAPVIAAGVALGAAWALAGDKIGPVLSDMWKKVQEVLGPPMTALLATVKQAFEEVMGSPLVAKLKMLAEFMGNLGLVMLKAFGGALPGIIQALGAVVTGVVSVIVDAIRIVVALLSKDWAGAWKAFKDLVKDAVDAVIGIITGLAGAVTGQIAGMVKGIGDWLGGKLGAIFNDVGKKIDAVKGWFFDLYDAVVGHSYVPDMVDEIGKNMARLQKLMVEPAKKATDATKKAFRQLQEDAAALLDRLFPAQAQVRAIMEDMAALDKDLKAGIVTPNVHAAGQAVLAAQLKDAQAKAAGKNTGSELRGIADTYLPDEATMRKLAEDAAALRQAIASGEGDVDAYKRALAAVEKEMVKAKEWPLKDELDGLVDSLLPAQAHLAKLRSEMALLDQALATGNIDPERYRQAALALQQEITAADEAARRAEMMTTTMGRVLVRIGDFGHQVGSSIMDALHAGIEGKNVFAALKDNFSNVLKNVAHSALSSLEKTIFGEGGIAKAMEDLFTKLFQSILKTSGSGGSGGGIWGAISTGISSLFGGRAGGGPVMANTPYIVGEKRPELFVPSTAGRVVPNLDGGGRGVVIQQSLTFSGGVDLATRTEVYRVADAARQAAIQGVQEINRRAP